MQTILIRAEVISRQDKSITVKLLNGYGKPEETIHIDAAITDPNSAPTA